MPDGPPPPLGLAWTLSAWTLLPLAIAVALYAAGVLRTRAAAIDGAAAHGRHALAFSAGVCVLVLALVWPLDAYAGYALSAHVGQHMALLAWAPPLLLAARPCALMIRAAPAHIRTRIARVMHSLDACVCAQLAAATVVHVATMWLWHLPAATAASLDSETIHRLMLASVLLAGLWFWRAVLHRLRTCDGGAAGGLVALVTAMMLMGFLGALLTFSPRLLYPAYTDRALLAGLDAVRDQQLAGLLMWVPSGLPYLIVGMCLVVALLRQEPRRPVDGPAA
ncbi:MAG: cytochrome c oxidase assembly protein [Luteimonas sp.]